MRTPAIPDAGPKRKLLDAAEQLFAEKGFDAVSVRDITKLAGANVAAVNYHFGSREGLLTLVMTRYLTPVNEERLDLLDQAEERAQGQPIPVEEIITAMCKPLIRQVVGSEMSERVFCKLLGRVMSEQSHSLPSAVEDQMKPMAMRFFAALRKTFPDSPPDEITWRFHFVNGAMLHTLTHMEMLKRFSNTPEITLDEIFERFLRFTVAGMCQHPPATQAGLKKPSAQPTFDF